MRRRALTSAALASSVALLLSACVTLPAKPAALPTDFVPEPTVSPGDGTGALSPDGFSAAQRMTVRVRNVGCGFIATGTGFALDSHTLVTNRHVVADAKRITITTYDGRSIAATAASTTTVADIAIITTEESLGSAYAFRAQEDPVEGDVITVVGYPNGGRLTSTAGVVLGPTTDPLGGAVGTVLATSASVEQGSSGSPVLDEDGRVVGVIYAKNYSNQSFIVPVSTLNTLLSEESLFVPESSCTTSSQYQGLP
ncbi:S1 family peptidase [Demequina mangrovi]|uniref:Trypsin-like peptidase domain-containing protein n=1 Tax=Demequina mangrovi TaxID=1043493 RepID=A0A1H6ZBL5_9MICO|nr:serine protease [Demequina mangrovi]SEJ46275.1 Trypsin-like peptidase domain-containing protein [Demequina mangrovi]